MEAAETAGETDGAAGETAAAERSLACPLKEDSPELREQLSRLADLTTTTDQAVIPGRVNINEAPRCVLLGVPGLDPGTVDRILALRNTVADDSDLARRHALWLWTEGLVDRAAMRALWPYVTGGGDVFAPNWWSSDRAPGERLVPKPSWMPRSRRRGRSIGET